jgi:hypothetical protein
MLKSAGVFVCSTPNKEAFPTYFGKSKNWFHVKEFSLDELRLIMNKHFSNFSVYSQDYVPYHLLNKIRINFLLIVSILLKYVGLFQFIKRVDEIIIRSAYGKGKIFSPHSLRKINRDNKCYEVLPYSTKIGTPATIVIVAKK